MRQLFLDKGDLVVKEVAQPLLDENSILVAVHYAYISAGAKVAKIDAQEGFFSNVPHKVKQALQAVSSTTQSGPIPTKSDGTLDAKVYSLGYSCSGVVISVGKKVTKFAPGDLVACADPYYAYHADLLCVRENFAVKVANKDCLKAASLTTIGAIALQGVRRAQIQLGERICVLGLGLMGQLTMQLAKLSGAVVMAADVIPSRIELARELGASAAFNATSDDIDKEIGLITERHGVDTTIICSASQSDSLIEHAIAITRRRGRIVIVGDVGLNIDREHFYEKEIDILSASAYSTPATHSNDRYNYNYPYEYVRWTPVRNMQSFLKFIEQGRLNVEPFIREEITLKQVNKAYQRIQNKMTFGVVLAYDRTQGHIIPAVFARPDQIGKENVVRFVPAVSDTVRVGIIGASESIQSILMPLIAPMRHVTMSAIVDSDVKNAIHLSKRYGVARVCAHEDELITSNQVDVVVIASAQTTHGNKAINALQHGKAVFVERPMVTDFSQLQLLTMLFKKNQNLPFCVNYHRSFSPFVQKIKEEVSRRSTPLMVQYRMNLPIPANTSSTSQAGRIITHVCQIVDVFCSLTEAQPVSVSVEAMHAYRDDIFPTDNVSASISFRDGSVCSVIFTTLGHRDMGSERMEVFYDEKSIVMEEYMELYGFGLSSRFNETVPVADRGHEALFSQFLHAVRKDPFVPPISYERLLTTAHITLMIDQLACEGGGKKELA